MKLEKGKKYILNIDVSGRILTYTATITDVDNDPFISFIDKYNNEYSYNVAHIISFEEVPEFEHL